VKPSTIAIDGPAASGKSTIGYHLARFLNYLYLDTGILYRAVTWAAIQADLNIHNETAVTELARQLTIEVTPATQDDGRQCTVIVDTHDISLEVHSPAVDAAVSPVSTYPEVRHILTQRMREIAARGQVVMVGRDIGTVVIPDAHLKLYVVASAEERARRRYQELQHKNTTVSYETVLENIRQRDQIDSSRAAAPLKPAPDAVLLDTTALTMEEMFRHVEYLVSQDH